MPKQTKYGFILPTCRVMQSRIVKLCVVQFVNPLLLWLEVCFTYISWKVPFLFLTSLYTHSHPCTYQKILQHICLLWADYNNSSLSKGDWFCAQLVCRQIILLASIVFPLDQDCMFQIWSDLSFQSRLDFSVVVASFGTKRRRRRQLQKILFIQSCKP